MKSDPNRNVFSVELGMPPEPPAGLLSDSWDAAAPNPWEPGNPVELQRSVRRFLKHDCKKTLSDGHASLEH